MRGAVAKSTGVKVSKRSVLALLKTKYNLSYRRIKRVPTTGNSEQNKVLRSLYAQRMLQVYSQSKIVVNVDESWIPAADFRRRRWTTKGGDNSLADTPLGHKVNMIVAVASTG